MSTLPNTSGPRAYPITSPPADRRFTLGLVFAVADVLAEHGFPRVQTGGDLVALQQTLYSFIYAPATAEPNPDGPVCMGAPLGIEADCGRPGPHGGHPMTEPPAVTA